VKEALPFGNSILELLGNLLCGKDFSAEQNEANLQRKAGAVTNNIVILCQV
jgi:hypothetical protein